VSPAAQHVIAKVAARVAKDPTSATVEDARKLAKAVLMLTGGK
jgi:hypothetical protein